MSTVTTTPTYTDQPSSVRASRPSFIGLVRGELFKLVRQWTPWIALVLMISIIILPYLLIFTGTGLKASDQFVQLRLLLWSGSDWSGPLACLWWYLRVDRDRARDRPGVQSGYDPHCTGARRGTCPAFAGENDRARHLGHLYHARWSGVIALLVVAQIQFAAGSLNALTSVPASVWHDLGIYLLTIVLSMGVTILMATAVSVAFRSLAGALSASIAWFPIDNALVLMMLLMSKLTDSTFWLNVTAYLLGPNLNAMAGVLTMQHSQSGALVFGPEVVVDSTHTLVVALVYSIIFAVIAIGITWKRDVKE